MYQHKHIVDAQPDQEAEYEGMHGTKVKADGRAEAKGCKEGENCARDADGCQCCSLLNAVPTAQNCLTK